jgi:uncharacterized protein YggE
MVQLSDLGVRCGQLAFGHGAGRRWALGRLLASIVAVQMVERPWGVAAYGAASVKAQPDLVRARFKVVRLEQTPTEAFAAASEAVHRVRQVLREHEVPDASVDRSRLSLKTEWTYVSNERKFLGYQCQAAFAAQSSHLDDIQQLLVDIVAAGANEIEAVEFDVVAKAELRAQARRKAVEAARNKAELYADAARIRLGMIVHIDDVDPEHVGVERYRSHSTAAAAAAQDLAPGHVVVSAAVILGFAIVPD